MTNIFEQLKDEVIHLYSEEVITDAELNQMTQDLIQFFTIAAKTLQRNNLMSPGAASSIMTSCYQSQEVEAK